jgi:hypothetical protein
VTRALQVCAPVVLLVAVVGCQRNEAGIRRDECLSASKQLAKSRLSTAETDCDCGREVWVVGIPSGKTTADKLQALGLPESASLGLTHEQYALPQWYVVVEDDPAQVPRGVISQEERRQFDIDCTLADQNIQELKVVRASRIRLKTMPNSDGRPNQLDVSKVR